MTQVQASEEYKDRHGVEISGVCTANVVPMRVSEEEGVDARPDVDRSCLCAGAR